jgi:hypothetical protein
VSLDREPQARSELWRETRTVEPVSKTLNPVRAYLITYQDMAHRKDFPDPDGALTTTLNVDIPVCMKLCDLGFRTFSGKQ